MKQGDTEASKLALTAWQTSVKSCAEDTAKARPGESKRTKLLENIKARLEEERVKLSANNKPDEDKEKEKKLLYRVHPEVITVAGGEASKVVDNMADSEVAQDVELTRFNLSFLAQEAGQVVDEGERLDRPGYSPGAPDYASPDVPVPGPGLSEASRSAVVPAGVKMGDAKLPDYLERRSNARFDIGHCIMPEAHLDGKKLYAMASTEDQFVVTGK